MTDVTITRTNGGWTVSLPNPFEAGEDTVVLYTDQNNPGMRRALALAAVSLAADRGGVINIDCFSEGGRLSMTGHVTKAAHELGYSLTNT